MKCSAGLSSSLDRRAEKSSKQSATLTTVRSIANTMFAKQPAAWQTMNTRPKFKNANSAVDSIFDDENDGGAGDEEDDGRLRLMKVFRPAS